MSNRALLVGINKYPSAPLSGCVNDVNDMASFLVSKCGFVQESIALLLDAQATTEGIRKSLTDRLLVGARAGDRLFFHYSGHGAQMPGMGADGRASLHDVICPVDFDWSVEHALSDQDFQRLFAGLPKGVEFNWVSDSCHSGDLARALGRAKGTPRHFPVPPEVACKISAARAANVKPAGFARAIEHLNGALLAGCKSDQTSMDTEFQGRANGAMTYFLLQVLRGPDGLAKPLTQVVQAVTKQLTEDGYPQEPQLRGQPAITQRPLLQELPIGAS